MPKLPIYDIDEPAAARQPKLPIYDIDEPAPQAQPKLPIYDIDEPATARQPKLPIYDIDEPTTGKLPIYDIEQVTPAEPEKFAKQTIESIFPKSWQGRKPLETGLQSAQYGAIKKKIWEDKLKRTTMEEPLKQTVKAGKGIVTGYGEQAPFVKEKLAETIEPKDLSKTFGPPPIPVAFDKYLSTDSVGNALPEMPIDGVMAKLNAEKYDEITPQGWKALRKQGKIKEIVRNRESGMAYINAMSKDGTYKKGEIISDLVYQLKGEKDIKKALPPPPSSKEIHKYLTGGDTYRAMGLTTERLRNKIEHVWKTEDINDPQKWKDLRLDNQADFIIEDQARLNQYLKVLTAEGKYTREELLSDLAHNAKQTQAGDALLGTITEGILGAPFRVLGGIVGEWQDQARYLGQKIAAPGMQATVEPKGYLKAVKESVLMEDPKYLTDVFQKGLKVSLGRELSTGENIAAGAYGLFAELLTGGQLLKVLRLGRGGPEVKGVMKQLDKAFKKHKLGKVSATHKDDIINLLREAANTPNDVTKIEMVRKGAANLANKLGLSDDAVMALDRDLIKQWGTKAQHFGKTGARVKLPVSEERARMVQVGEAKRVTQYDEKVGRVKDLVKKEERLKGLHKKTPKDKKTMKDLFRVREDIHKARQELKAPSVFEQSEWAQTPSRLVPLGGERTGSARIPGMGFFKYGGGAPKGTFAALRPAQAYKSLGGEHYVEQAKKMRSLIQEGEKKAGNVANAMREEERMRTMIDLKSTVDTYDSISGDLNKKIRKIGEISGKKKGKLPKDIEEILKGDKPEAAIRRLNGELVDLEADMEKALKQAGVSMHEAEAGYIPKNAYQKQAYDIYTKSADDMYKELKQLGITQGERTSYAPRIETRELRDARRRVFGKSFQDALARRSREQGLRSDIIIGPRGTKTREFIQSVVDSHLEKSLTFVAAKSSNIAEKAAITGARELTDDAAKAFGFRNKYLYSESPDFLKQLEKQNLTPYVTQTGTARGEKVYLIDKSVGKELERFMDPGRIPKLAQHWMTLHNWWKAGATIFRPGFLVRNVMFGNMSALWQADVDIVNSLARGANAMKRAKAFTGDLLTSSMFDKIGNAAAKTTGKIGKEALGIYDDLDTVVKLGLKHKVGGGGWFAQELAKPTAARGFASEALQTALPLNQKFFVARGVRRLNQAAEEYFRWSLYMGKIAKGFTAKEASQAVAKYLFNYDELAQFSRAAKQGVSFMTWSSKNLAMQTADILSKPDKVANFVRAYTGMQDLDPVSGELMESLPGWLKGATPTFLPGVRGDDDSRMVSMGEGLFPIVTAWHELKLAEGLSRGEFKKKFKEVFHGAIDQLQPMIRMAAEQGTSKNPDVVSAWTLRHQNKNQWYQVPSYISNIMHWAKEHHPGAWKYLTSTFAPSGEYALGYFPDYKWESGTAEAFSTLIPQLGTVNRFFRHGDESEYREVLAWLTGGRVYELDEKQRTKWKAQELEKKKVLLQDIFKSVPKGIFPKR